MTEIFSTLETKFSQPVSANKAKEAVPTAVVSVDNNVAAQNINDNKKDEFVSKSEESKVNKGPFKSLRKLVSNIRKNIAAVSEYTKGTFKGIKDGIIFGSIAFTGVTLKHNISQKAIRKAAEKAGEAIPAITKSKLAIPAAIVVAGIAFAKNIWVASLNTNRKKSDIHHTYIGH